ncbi:hypothetical protein HK097_006740 [Rhizophlyctis rosea]|uniref:Uncharacterized protein n=1 Tax=Rhizophlyctis rosea TaxID=64517 RepID=A0AAD5SFG4_9FUNG|nr:hypothetical protein HK097_006740 [Rhizophlyctis rosea]
MIVKDRKLYCKVIEAKNLYSEKTRHADTYCTVSVENGETRRTPTVCNESDPFFGEELLFEENLPATLWRVNLNVFNAIGTGSGGGAAGGLDRLLGRVSFPREWLEDGAIEEEQWFVLMPPDTESQPTGEVRLSVQLRVDESQQRQKTIVVTVFQARNLMYQSPGVDPFLVIHLIPDPQASTTQRTQCIKETTSPTFNETFVFPINDIHPNQQLHVSMWDAAHGNSFLGHFSLPITDLEPNEEGFPRWRSLLPKPRHMFHTKMSAKEKRRTAEFTNNTQKAKIFVQDMQSTAPDSKSTTKKEHKLIDTKFTSICVCGHCGATLEGGQRHYQCSTCKFSCHVPCAKFTANDCGGVGTLRVKLKYSVSSVLNLENYRPFLDLISASSFRLAHLFGKVSKDREEAAMCFIKLMEASGKTQGFLCDIITSEVEETADPNTLFRANSMASKAVDVYMKYLGLPYLRQTIGPIIKHIVAKKVQLELDPTRVDKADEIRRNRKALIEWNKKILDAIWEARGTVPSAWRPVFCHIQAEVMKKFPQDETARYTCVGGFVFLRFFAPAILGPKLFGIIDEYVDPKTSRTLTLLAKTLQNLANLVRFAQKEAYMMDVNPFIDENIERMKSYIDGLATKEAVVKKEATLHHVHFEVAREAARLYHFYVRASPLILQTMQARDAPLIRELTKLLTKLTLETTAADATTDSDNKFAFPALKKSYALLLDLRTKFEDTIARIPDLNLPLGIDNIGSSSQATLGEVAIVDSAKMDVERPLLVAGVEGEPTSRQPSRKGPVFSSVQLRVMDSTSTMLDDDEQEPPTPLDSEPSLSSRPSLAKRRESAVDDLDAALAHLAAHINDKSGENSRRASVLSDGGPTWGANYYQPPSMPLPALPPGAGGNAGVGGAGGAGRGGRGPVPALRVERAEGGSGRPSTAGPDIPSRTATPSPDPIPRTATPDIPPTPDHPAARRGRGKARNQTSSQTPNTQTPSAILAMLASAKDTALSQADAITNTNPSKPPPQCKACSQPVFSDLLEFQGSAYHKDHFVCNKCTKVLDPASAKFKNGLLWCMTDFLARYPPCYECQNSIETPSIITALNRTYHPDCFSCEACGSDYYKRAELMCGICGGMIEQGYVVIAGRKYHVECKRCDRCQTPLASKPYFTIGDETFCTSHQATMLTCSACNKLITSTNRITHMPSSGRYFHPDCFKCIGCERTLLGSAYYDWCGKPKCEGCYLASF